MQLHRSQHVDYTVAALDHLGATISAAGFAATITNDVANNKQAGAVITVVKQSAGVFRIAAVPGAFNQSLSQACVTFSDGVNQITEVIEVIPDTGADFTLSHGSAA